MKPIITIVGSRKADAAAIKRASLLASSLQASSWIRTGDAWGIDAAVCSACSVGRRDKCSTTTPRPMHSTGGCWLTRRRADRPA